MNAPLAGVKVVEVAQVASGPMAGRILAELGADVTKIEPPQGDLWRSVPPFHEGMSAPFYSVNAGKRSIVLDLQKKAALDVALNLIAEADVVLENWRPGVAARLGLDWDEIRRSHPELIVVAIRGYGDTGPRSQDRVYDPVIQAVSGLSYSQRNGERPDLLTTILPDKIAGMTAAQAVLGALFQRTHTGVGQYIPVSMLDATVSFAAPDLFTGQIFADAPTTDRPDHKPPRTSAIVRTGDGGYLAFTSMANAYWTSLCDLLGDEELHEEYSSLRHRAENIGDVATRVETLIQGFGRDELIEELTARGIPCGPVYSYAEVLKAPQVKHNDLVREVHRPGLGTVREFAPAARLEGRPEDLSQPPDLGGDGVAVLQGLGIDPADIDSLIESGAVRLPPSAPARAGLSSPAPVG